MRISTNQLYASSTSMMTQLSAQASDLQTQISTQKRISGAADDPVAYLRLQTIGRATANDSAYSSNIKLAQGVLSQSDTALSSIQTQLTQAKELALQASNGTLSDSDRASIATQLDQIRDSIYGLANTKDARGVPLFGGATGDAAYTKAADGTISFAGTGTQASIPIGDGDSIATSVSGTQAFSDGNGGDIFSVLGNLSAALKAGGDVSQASADALSGLDTTMNNVTDAQASVGARAARLDLTAQSITDVGANREVERSGLEDTDYTTAIAALQKTMTALQATQASFTKLSSLSLFNYLN